MSDWRIGFSKNPCGFKPAHDYPWHNRFDDVLRQYRTIYCARSKRTCFRELLADFRPNAKAINDYKKKFKDKPLAGVVLEEWYDKRVLVEVKVVTTKGGLVNLESIEERAKLMTEHAGFFANSGIDNFDIPELRKKDRLFTQYLSRLLFDKGKAGIQFRSHLDNGICTALFENRAHLKAISAPVQLDPHMTEFKEVCKEFGISIV